MMTGRRWAVQFMIAAIMLAGFLLMRWVIG
jgi:hypothetical protein